ncbi:MAG: HAD-IIIC family phosphatase [Magnetococcales bacterium]|nr:HAD-IIIC family phosphatase [Magnetococcales bacterium]
MGSLTVTLILADFTVKPLVQSLNRRSAEPRFAARSGPFDQVLPVLLDPDHAAWQPAPSLLVVWTRPEAAVPAYARLLAGQTVAPDDLRRDVQRFADLLRTAAGRVATLLAPSWSRPPVERGLGLADLRPGMGLAHALTLMNLTLADGLAPAGNAFVLDSQRWLAQCGSRSWNPKLWYLGKLAWTPELLALAAADLAAAVVTVSGQARKILFLDLDETLWGEILGEVGWRRLTLGGHHPVGEALRDFQLALKRLKDRGVLLAILSKNREELALEALREHPEMVLRPEDFVGWRIDWNDKAANLAALLEEVNLLPQSAVFIDDNPAERARVREALPEVLVPDWPRDKLRYREALERLDCFDSAGLTAEDAVRTASYMAERQRRQSRTAVGSLAEWLGSLGLTIRVAALGADTLPRAAQLLNKTNQMNLRTRRLGEGELQHWAVQPGQRLWVFRVADRFGDYGLTAITGLTIDGDQARVSDFLLSCRVMGRGVERAMLHVLVRAARAAGCRTLAAEGLPTARNGPCLEFFRRESGWEGDGDRYVWDPARDYPVPGHVSLIDATRPG